MPACVGAAGAGLCGEYCHSVRFCCTRYECVCARTCANMNGSDAAAVHPYLIAVGPPSVAHRPRRVRRLHRISTSPVPVCPHGPELQRHRAQSKNFTTRGKRRIFILWLRACGRGICVLHRNYCGALSLNPVILTAPIISEASRCAHGRQVRVG